MEKKSNAELRAEALKLLRAGRWMGKFLVVWTTIVAFAILVQLLWTEAIEANEIQTWEAFLLAKAQAIASGLDLTVPSRTIMYRMHLATAFDTFLDCIVGGISAFAMTCLTLRAAKGETDRWYPASLGGFARPLDMAWLQFRYLLQVWLWSCLFVIPGIIAAYRYSQCWYLKVDHPDWSAGKCLAESGKMMAGNKWRLFSLQCSYWRPISLLLLVLLAVSATAALPLGGLLTAAIVFALSVLCFYLAVYVAVYLGIGQALFYREL